MDITNNFQQISKVTQMSAIRAHDPASSAKELLASAKELHRLVDHLHWLHESREKEFLSPQII
jgi:hypothetical protein